MAASVTPQEAPARFLDQFEELRMELSNDQVIAEAVEINHRKVGDEKTLRLTAEAGSIDERHQLGTRKGGDANDDGQGQPGHSRHADHQGRLRTQPQRAASARKLAEPRAPHFSGQTFEPMERSHLTGENGLLSVAGMEISEVPPVFPSGHPPARLPEDRDLMIQAAVLARVRGLHPERITVAELIRELAGEEADFAAKDEIERAATDLSGVGLLHLVNGFVSPTRAALRAEELSDR